MKLKPSLSRSRVLESLFSEGSCMVFANRILGLLVMCSCNHPIRRYIWLNPYHIYDQQLIRSPQMNCSPFMVRHWYQAAIRSDITRQSTPLLGIWFVARESRRSPSIAPTHPNRIPKSDNLTWLACQLSISGSGIGNVSIFGEGGVGGAHILSGLCLEPLEISLCKQSMVTGQNLKRLLTDMPFFGHNNAILDDCK